MLLLFLIIIIYLLNLEKLIMLIIVIFKSCHNNILFYRVLQPDLVYLHHNLEWAQLHLKLWRERGKHSILYTVIYNWGMQYFDFFVYCLFLSPCDERPFLIRSVSLFSYNLCSPYVFGPYIDDGMCGAVVFVIVL